MDPNRTWCFDEKVAAEFDAHARANIPGYEQVVGLSVAAVEAYCQPQDLIAEVGCATGYTLNCLEKAGYFNTVGIDNSPAMLERCRKGPWRLIRSEEFPSELGPYKAILVNWTLHFIQPANRLAYLKSLASSLVQDGILIVTDKTAQSEFVERMYHDFKRRMGMSESDIAAKKRSLAGVLETLPHDWYCRAFWECGLESEILWAQYGFVTYLCRPKKPAPDSRG